MQETYKLSISKLEQQLRKNNSWFDRNRGVVGLFTGLVVGGWCLYWYRTCGVSTVSKKLDWEYVASVEKAIAEKYGKQTVQDFRSEWDEQKEKEYLEQLKNATLIKSESNQDKVDVDGILISKKASKRKYDRTCPCM